MNIITESTLCEGLQPNETVTDASTTETESSKIVGVTQTIVERGSTDDESAFTDTVPRTDWLNENRQHKLGNKESALSLADFIEMWRRVPPDLRPLRGK